LRAVIAVHVGNYANEKEEDIALNYARNAGLTSQYYANGGIRCLCTCPGAVTTASHLYVPVWCLFSDVTV